MTRVNPAGDPVRIEGEDGVVTVQKVYTRMGERLELDAPAVESTARLDAIALESVSWQDPADLAARAEAVDRQRDASASPDDGDERSEPISVSSEFAQARVEGVTEEGRDKLEITAPKLGYSVRLGARELEWLSLQDHETFSAWLEQPFGPAGDDHDHGH
jgi:hypothetical protein